MGDPATGEATRWGESVGEAMRRGAVEADVAREGEVAGDATRSDAATADEVRARAAGTRRRRRVTTQAVPGSDPTPQNEPARHAENENDERLKADKPPHWG
ncbi:hypothetical protein BHD05_05745 [Marisediminicola antarctica]|uniref:Uncharacterized protein n=2 Tax=Marisediminicola antarctica TaxID=674079 RepID=A0A7L5AFH4_9MICO|nr:hypothetical protein BHD05_05745 [Marisediminicola antarctica]